MRTTLGVHMSRFWKHILIPAVAPVAIVALYLTPVSLVGCVNRGIAALAIVFVSLFVGIGVALAGIRARRRKDGSTGWWIASVLILLAPAVLVLGPLG